MKYNIMFKILMQLLLKRKITARELADKYEVSVRSIYRYIDEMIICGVPIDVARGRYGGLTIADTFRLPTGYFTRGEYTATLNALDAMSQQISDENLTSAREKLACRIKFEKHDLSVSGNIIIDGGTWGDSNRFSDKMRVCEQAVNESKSIMIDYFSREGIHSKRVIDPHILVYKQNVWYVYAFCHNKQTFRTFKIGRIKSAAFTGETFVKKHFSKNDIAVNFTYSDKQLMSVTFEVAKESLADVEEWLGIDNIEPRGKGFIAEVRLPDDDLLVNKILGYGGSIKVISPPSLRERIARLAGQIAKQYT